MKTRPPAKANASNSTPGDAGDTSAGPSGQPAVARYPDSPPIATCCQVEGAAPAHAELAW